MDASIKESVKASDKEAQYDEKAKKLLGHKIILAYILVNTVEEFQGMNPEDVVKYIEGEPYISTVPLDPGMTNTKERKEGSIKETETPEQIRGLNTENSELNEGMMRFDIIFYVRMKDGLTQIIVNIEAQKEEPGKYYILNRAIFYIGRIVSSQKGRDFVKSEYNKMKRAYSIWICMNMKENSLTQIYLTKKNIIGSHDWKGDLELLNIIMIGIAENLPEKEENYELHRLLYGNHFPLAAGKTLTFSSIPTLRIMIEIKIKYALGIIGLQNIQDNSFIPIQLSRIFDTLDDYIKNKKVIFSIDYSCLKHIYEWTNIYIHSGFNLYTWYPFIFEEYLRPFFNGGNITNNYNMKAGIIIKRIALAEIRAKLEECIIKPNITNKNKTHNHYKLKIFNDESILGSVLID